MTTRILVALGLSVVGMIVAAAVVTVISVAILTPAVAGVPW